MCTTWTWAEAEPKEGHKPCLLQVLVQYKGLVQAVQAELTQHAAESQRHRAALQAAISRQL